MYSPYEELEFLSDYLPDEGETVLVTRQDGELVCKPYGRDGLREGIENSELYGFLVKANERLHAVGAVPLWITVIGFIWSLILVFAVLQLTWMHWYIVPALGFPALCGAFHWIRIRQRRFFQKQIVPLLIRELNDREIHPNALVAGVRQHGELRTLLDELILWNPPVKNRL